MDYVGAADALGVVARKRARRRFNQSVLEANKASSLERRLAQERAIGSGWLQLQYGWKPLLDDVYGSCEFLANRGLTELRGIAIGRATVNATNTQSYPCTVGVRQVTMYPNVKDKYTVKYTVHYSTSNTGLKQLSELGITNPLMIAWELMPYSFVVDWFLPIGNWINSFDATLGLTFKQGCRTTHRYTGGTTRAFAVDKIVSGEWYNFDATYFSEKVDVVRTLLTSFPTANFPRLKNPVSYQHVANAMALLTSNARRGSGFTKPLSLGSQ